METLPTLRLMWVRWSYCHCLFCGRTTQRRAIFNSLIFICHHCDLKEWQKLVCVPLPLTSLQFRNEESMRGNRNVKKSSATKPSSQPTSFTRTRLPTFKPQTSKGSTRPYPLPHLPDFRHRGSKYQYLSPRSTRHHLQSSTKEEGFHAYYQNIMSRSLR
jgi:hypothetical protein